MTSVRLGLATLLAALSAPAGAMPPAALSPSANGPVVLVGGCHSDVRVHYVPEIGDSAAHYHRQGSCSPVLVQAVPTQRGQPVDCHRDVRVHRIAGIMLRHRHVGDDCQVREVRQATEFLPN